jgi:hypothetical protein
VKDGRIERLAGNALEALQDQQALQSLGNA